MPQRRSALTYCSHEATINIPVHVDNNATTAVLPLPRIGSIGAGPDGGFPRYDLATTPHTVRLAFQANSPLRPRGVAFAVTRGSSEVAAAVECELSELAATCA